jgi:4-diphosphocytidyl-2-C-methyl-D-erythritol kinase
LSGESYKKLLAIDTFVTMITFPQCKINLGLNIHFKRADNYHEVSTVMYPIPLKDILEIVRHETFQFTQSGMPIPGKLTDNLCVKAYQLLHREFDIPPVHAHLYKNIPMGGGLGGGSADGTYMLKLLNDEFELGLATAELQDYAAQLGSDCPFFVREEPQLATGRGELLKPININLEGYYLYLINDGTHISTQEAFANVSPRQPERSLDEIISLPIDQWKAHLHNQFEESVFPLYPHLERIKNQLYDAGAIYASMSGSGATLFGLFKSEPSSSFFKSEKFASENFIKL